MKLRNLWNPSIWPALMSGLLACAALTVGPVYWNIGVIPSGTTPALLDYLGRDALPDDLPNIPAPPRSAKRTLYDTLQGSQPATAPLPARRETRGSDLPLLPDRRVNETPRAKPQPEKRASASGKPARQAVPQLVAPAKPRPAAKPAVNRPAAKRRVPAGTRIGPPTRAEAAAKKSAPALRKPAPSAAKALVKKPVTLAKPRAAAKSETVSSSKRIVPGSRRTRGKYDPQIPPTPRTEFRYYAPEYYRGLYLNSGVVTSKKRYSKLFAQGKRYGINTIVADVQPRFPSEDFIRSARENGFYLVARVVVFEGGLKQPTIPKKHLNRVLDVAERAARSGFMEIQLDYIRFADRAKIGRLGQAARYRTIAGILKMATERLRPLGVRVGADIFGRIPFNQNDRIGQRLEVFAEHLDTLYPMLYPSHFYGDPGYQKNPYKTILHGQQKTVARVGDQIKTIAYIQAFKMKVKMSGLSYHNYMVKQLQGSADSGGAGFVVWNARSAYAPFFRALADFDKRQKATGRAGD